jgi:NAD(P)-dependent dehydrogenase (short-subunit alcohol dehydrogenase family)
MGHESRPGSVVVTGAAQGIDAAISTSLASDGWHVVGVDLAEDRLVNSMQSIPGEHGYIVGDITDDRVIAKACEVAAQSGPVKGFVANAGLIGPGPSSSYSLDQWNQLVNVMLTGPFLGSRVAAQWMLDTGTGGSICMTSSIAGQLGFGARAAYCAAKAGVNGLVRSLAVEWAQNRIRVNAVAPGAIDTNLQSAMKQTGHSSTDTYLKHIPMKRIGQPSEIADVVSFLLSDRSTYVTGTVIPVDGGWSAYGMDAGES